MESAFGIEHGEGLVEKSFREGFKFGREDVRSGVTDGLSPKASRRDTHRMARSVRRNRNAFPPGSAHSLTHHVGTRVGAESTRVKKSDADSSRTRQLGAATGVTAGGALAARGLQASGGATQRMAYNLARNNPAAKGSFSSEKARRLRPYVQMSEKGAQIQRLGRTGSRGLALGAAGLGVATGASALLDRRRVAKSASVSAFGVEHA